MTSARKKELRALLLGLVNEGSSLASFVLEILEEVETNDGSNLPSSNTDYHRRSSDDSAYGRSN